jgi:hypothetical protein
LPFIEKTRVGLLGMLTMFSTLSSGCGESNSSPSDQGEIVDLGTTPSPETMVGAIDPSPTNDAGREPEMNVLSPSNDASLDHRGPVTARPMFIACGGNLRRVVSYDGAKWFGDQTTPSGSCSGGEGDNCVGTACAAGNGTFLVGNAHAVLTSRDGVTWDKAGAPFVYPIPVEKLAAAYGAGRFVVVGRQNTYVSEDGRAWTLHDKAIKALGNWRMTFGNGKFVVLNRVTNSSIDGVQWITKGFGLELLGVGAGNGRFVAVGHPGFSTSEDGITWAPPLGVTPSGGDFSAVGYLKGVWVICGGASTTGCWASRDNAKTWKQHSSQGIRWMVVAADHFWGVAGTEIFRSSDGAVWHRVFGAPGQEFMRIAHGM